MQTLAHTVEFTPVYSLAHIAKSRLRTSARCHPDPGQSPSISSERRRWSIGSLCSVPNRCTHGSVGQMDQQDRWHLLRSSGGPRESQVAARRSETEEMSEMHAAATAKIRLWGNRADRARKDGRKADADRCDDKVRDWISRARQIERMQNSVNSGR